MEFQQKSLVTTVGAKAMGIDEYPLGFAAVVAVMVYEGAIEDPLVIAKSAVERGMGTVTVYKTYSTTAVQSNSRQQNLGIPPPEAKHRRVGSYDKINPFTGVPDPGTALVEGDIIIAQYEVSKRKRKLDKDGEPEDCCDESKFQIVDTSIPLKMYSGTVIIDDVQWSRGQDGKIIVKVQTRQVRQVEVGDKFTTRHAQKGVVMRVVPDEDMPVTADGMRPDIIYNPCFHPSRKTNGNIAELPAGKAAALLGSSIDFTPFRNMPAVGAWLQECGFEWSGRETMYDGITGEMLQEEICIGICDMNRLRHMAVDKLSARGHGMMTPIYHQPTEGRAFKGGLRVGEMERDTLLGHGSTCLLLDRMVKCSDGTSMVYCSRCGVPAEYIGSDPAVDHPDDPNHYRCRGCLNAALAGTLHRDDILPCVKRSLPQSMFILQQYMQTMGFDVGLFQK